MPSKKVVTTVLLSLLVVIVALGTLTLSTLFSTTVEAQSSQRFRFEATGKWTEEGETSRGTFGTLSYKVAVICDTANGNLIYISGASQSSPAVIPNGCEKSPR